MTTTATNDIDGGTEEGVKIPMIWKEGERMFWFRKKKDKKRKNERVSSDEGLRSAVSFNESNDGRRPDTI